MSDPLFVQLLLLLTCALFVGQSVFDLLDGRNAFIVMSLLTDLASACVHVLFCQVLISWIIIFGRATAKFHLIARVDAYKRITMFLLFTVITVLSVVEAFFSPTWLYMVLKNMIMAIFLVFLSVGGWYLPCKVRSMLIQTKRSFKIRQSGEYNRTFCLLAIGSTLGLGLGLFEAYTAFQWFESKVDVKQAQPPINLDLDVSFEIILITVVTWFTVLYFKDSSLPGAVYHKKISCNRGIRSHIRLSHLQSPTERGIEVPGAWPTFEHPFSGQEGDQVWVRLPPDGEFQGVVRYIGQPPDSDGVIVGVEFRVPVGVSDGTYQGRRYFEADTNCAAFVSPIDVEKMPSDDDISDLTQRRCRGNKPLPGPPSGSMPSDISPDCSIGTPSATPPGTPGDSPVYSTRFLEAVSRDSVV